MSEQPDKDNAGELCTDSGEQEIVADPSFFPRYPVDYLFAQLFASGDGKAWQAFDREYRPKVSLYVKQRYPNQFSDIEIEEICDNVQERLMANNYRALRIYRGECPFWRYLVMAVEWEAKNRLRKRFVPPPAEGYETYDPFEDSPEGPVPAILSEVLSDELRWAFLLRYYYYFGFPLEEIRLLAKKRGLPIKEITGRIVRAFEGSQEGPLWRQIEKQQEVQRKLQQTHREILVLQDQIDRLSQDVDLSSQLAQPEKLAEKEQKLTEKEQKLEAIEQRRKKLLEQIRGERGIVKTPYEVIGQILGESNTSIIRGRVYQAKHQLKQALKKRNLGGTQQNE